MSARRTERNPQRPLGSAAVTAIPAIITLSKRSSGRALQAAARSFGASRPLASLKPAEIKARCIETLGQARAAVDAKAPDDAAAFKRWLREISQHVAEAAKEGGFLGIGGVLVSEAEKATLTEISGALGLAA
jgi:hypothetical protein